jgi:hypothetical protein
VGHVRCQSDGTTLGSHARPPPDDRSGGHEQFAGVPRLGGTDLVA